MQLAWTCHPLLTLGLALRVRNSGEYLVTVNGIVVPVQFDGGAA